MLKVEFGAPVVIRVLVHVHPLLLAKPGQWLPDLSACIPGGLATWLPLSARRSNESAGAAQEAWPWPAGAATAAPSAGGYLVRPLVRRQSGRKGAQRRQRQFRSSCLL